MTGGLVNQKYVSSPWVRHTNWLEGYVGSRTTTHDVANEKFDLILGKNNILGWFEIEVTGGYTWGRTTGRMCKHFDMYLSANGEIQGSGIAQYYTFADKWISNYFAIGDIAWDSARGWYIKMGKTQLMEGNPYHVHFRAFCNNGSPPHEDISLSNIYTTDTSTFPAPVLQLPSNACLWDGTTNKQIATVDDLSYSTTEKRIGTWIDGKTLYQNTISCGALPNSMNKNIPHNISGIDTVVEIKGIAHNSTKSSFIVLPHTTPSTQYITDIQVNTSIISINTKENMGNTWTTSYITLKYTKTI